MVVYGGAVVCGSVWWCMVVYGGVRWWIYPDASASLPEHSDDSTKGLHGGATHPIPTKGVFVHGGVRWCATVVYGGVRWCGDVLWCAVVDLP